LICQYLQDGLHRRYDEYVLTAPRDSRGFPRAPTRAHLAKFVIESLDLDDPDDRVHTEAMMNDSDEEMEADPHEDLETVPDSGTEFDTDGKNLSSSTMTFAED
jgi:hypothetical protein